MLIYLFGLLNLKVDVTTEETDADELAALALLEDEYRNKSEHEEPEYPETGFSRHG